MMKQITFSRLLLSAVLLTLAADAHVFAQLIPNLGGQRAGISAFQFLKLGAGARGVGMGESFVAVANDASALYWNPAGLTQFTENEFLFAHTEYVVDIRHEYFGAAYHLTPNDAIGVALTSLYMDKMEITTEAQPFGTGNYFSFGDVAVGLTYARRMTDQFSFGITVRYVEETLDLLKMRGAMVDLGTYYWTGLGSSRFAIVISNFGADVTPSGEVTEYGGAAVNTFQSFSPPTLFKIGFAMEPYQTEEHRITSSLELNHPNDNAENVHLGVEYQWQKWLRLRLGLKRTIGERLIMQDNSNAGSYSLGFGVVAPVSVTSVKVDYAYSNFSLLGGIHRISVSLSY
jgi:hypothetical protein